MVLQGGCEHVESWVVREVARRGECGGAKHHFTCSLVQRIHGLQTRQPAWLHD